MREIPKRVRVILLVTVLQTLVSTEMDRSGKVDLAYGNSVRTPTLNPTV
jgi:hypothetical protein